MLDARCSMLDAQKMQFYWKSAVLRGASSEQRALPTHCSMLGHRARKRHFCSELQFVNHRAARTASPMRDARCSVCSEFGMRTRSYKRTVGQPIRWHGASSAARRLPSSTVHLRPARSLQARGQAVRPRLWEAGRHSTTPAAFDEPVCGAHVRHRCCILRGCIAVSVSYDDTGTCRSVLRSDFHRRVSDAETMRGRACWSAQELQPRRALFEAACGAQ